jgi:hypothetical protein
MRIALLKRLSGGLFLSILIPTSNHLGDLSGLNSSELGLREIRFLSRFIGSPNGSFSPTLYPPLHNCITQGNNDLFERMEARNKRTSKKAYPLYLLQMFGADCMHGTSGRRADLNERCDRLNQWCFSRDK